MSDDLRSLQRQLGELTARAAIAEALARTAGASTAATRR